MWRPPPRPRWPRCDRTEGENPYDLWHDLQTVMQDLVGIIRRKHELEDSIKRLADLKVAHRDGRPRPVAASTTRVGTSPWTCAT